LEKSKTKTGILMTFVPATFEEKLDTFFLTKEIKEAILNDGFMKRIVKDGFYVFSWKIDKNVRKRMVGDLKKRDYRFYSTPFFEPVNKLYTKADLGNALAKKDSFIIYKYTKVKRDAHIKQQVLAKKPLFLKKNENWYRHNEWKEWVEYSETVCESWITIQDVQKALILQGYTKIKIDDTATALDRRSKRAINHLQKKNKLQKKDYNTEIFRILGL
jgi:hypothetical protein